jgi:hypothetical protein
MAIVATFPKNFARPDNALLLQRLLWGGNLIPLLSLPFDSLCLSRLPVTGNKVTQTIMFYF